MLNPHIPLLSVSELETFVRCQKEYELKYVHGIQKPAINTKANIELSAVNWGLLVHEVMCFLDFTDLSNIETVIDQAFINQQCIEDTHLRQKIRELVKKLSQHPQWQALIPMMKLGQAELPFTLYFDGFMIRGAFDRLILTDQEWTVIDFKTDKVKSASEAGERMKVYEIQMSAYALAAHEASHKKNGRALFVFTEGPYFVETVFTHEVLEGKRNDITNICKKITSSHEPYHYPSNIPVPCHHCPFYPENYCGVKTHP